MIERCLAYIGAFVALGTGLSAVWFAALYVGHALACRRGDHEWWLELYSGDFWYCSRCGEKRLVTAEEKAQWAANERADELDLPCGAEL